MAFQLATESSRPIRPEVVAPRRARPNAPLTAGEIVVQRRCACGGGCPRCEEGRATDGTESGVPTLVGDVLSSPGKPLDERTRRWVEPRTGLDFSHVRVHTDARAARSAESIEALAYTSGNNIVFGRGHYAPSTDRGRRLLGHELAHVAQQSGITGAGIAPKTLDPPSHPRERQADRLADALMSDRRSSEWLSSSRAPRGVISRAGTVRCRRGRHSAPRNARALIEASERLASIACTTASLDLQMLQLQCMRGLGTGGGFRVPTTRQSANYQRFFGLPPRVRGRYRNRISQRLYRTQGEALMREARSLSNRYGRMSSRLLSNIDYRCIGGRTVWGRCIGHCRGRTATACGGRRMMLCPRFWTALGFVGKSYLLVHEAAHLVFRIRHGRNFRHAECYASFASAATNAGWAGTPACRP